MAGYTRQSTMADGDTITAALFNNEYNQLVNAFSNTSGHAHDGTAANGPVIGLIGDAGETSPNNKVVIDTTNNYIEFYVEVSSSPVQQLYIADGAIIPVTDNDIDLGTSSLEFKDLYIDGTANLDSLVLGSGSTVTAILDEDDLSSDSATSLATQQSIKAYVDAQVTAQDLDFQGDSGGALSIDLDSESLTIAGGTGIDTSGATNTLTVAIDSTVATLTGTQTLTNKTIDAASNTLSNIANSSLTNSSVSYGGVSVALGGTDATPAFNLSDATAYPGDSSLVTTGALNSGSITSGFGAIDNGSSNITTTGTVTYGSLSDGVITITAFADEDDMVSNSATLVPTQQSVKAYVDAQVATANELSELTDVNLTTPADASLLFYDTLTSKWIDNVVSGDITIADTGVAAISSGVIVNDDINASAAISVSKTALTAGTGLTLSTDTLAIDSTVATLTGTQTLTNKTLTSPVLNTGVSGTAFLDDDTFATATASTLASSESIKAYVDSSVGGISSNSITDADGDTKIQVEESADEDIIRFDTAGSERMVINATGNLGIGTASPTELLHVYEGTSTDSAVLKLESTTNLGGDPVGELQFFNTAGASSEAGAYIKVNSDSTGRRYYNMEFGTGRNAAADTKMIIDNNGQVGIGTSSPATDLAIVKSTSPTLRLERSGASQLDIIASTAVAGSIIDAQSNHLVIKTSTAEYIAFETNDTERMRIDSSGNVGIGTSSPVSIGGHTGVLTLYGSNATALVLQNSTSSSRIAQLGSDLAFFNNTYETERMRLTSTGLGIGTSSPSNALHVNSGATNIAGVFESSDSIASIAFKDNSTTSTSHVNIGAAANDMFIVTGGTEKVRIEDGGNVGIGTSSPATPLHVKTNSSGYALTIEENSGGEAYQIGTDSFGGLAFFNSGTKVADFADSSEFQVYASGAVKAKISPTGDSYFNGGNVGIGTSSINNPSSGRQVVELNGASEGALLNMSVGGSRYGYLYTTASGTELVSINSYLAFKANGAERMTVLSNGDVGIGTTSNIINSSSGVGIYFENGADLIVGRNGGAALSVLRQGSDGQLVRFKQAGTEEGNISVSGATVSYNGFSGNHETSGIPSNTEIGTVCSTIDELDTYVSGTKSGQNRADHAKIKISDVEGDSRVYGVLASFSETDNKPIVASVGIGSVKVTGACSGGDLLESNGDGTAKVQSDDIIRSKTIGKVTIGNSNTGVKLVSCVLYCG